MSKLWCAVCHKYKANITRHKNFSRAWIDGSDNHKTSNILGHSTNERHKSAMMPLRKDQARSKNDPITSYSPVARSLSSSSVDSTVRERMNKKVQNQIYAGKRTPTFHQVLSHSRVGGDAWS